MPKRKKGYVPSISSFGGYKYGQKVFVKRYPDGKLGYGAIESFHVDSPSDGEDYISFACEMCGQFRLANMTDIIKKPTKYHDDRLKASKKMR